MKRELNEGEAVLVGIIAVLFFGVSGILCYQAIEASVSRAAIAAGLVQAVAPGSHDAIWVKP